jgi:hypothetical protein
MTQELNEAHGATAAALPHPAVLQEINIYGHSTLLYWWPAWAVGFLFALLNAGQEKFLATAEGAKPSSALGLTFVSLMMFFVFDRMTYWRIRPGQMTEEHLIGGGAESYDTNGLRFQKLGSDFFRVMLGLGAGDLRVMTVGGSGTTIEIANVLFIDGKVRAIEKLISVKPEHTS